MLAVWLGGSGCASQMALESTKWPAKLKRESVGLFTLRMENEYKPAYQPQVEWFRVVAEKTGKTKCFEPGAPSEMERKQFFEYLVSVNLPPGRYTLQKVAGVAWSPSLSILLLAGNFRFPVNGHFDLPPQAVVYLGHVRMVNRKREANERRSGGPFPLIDQAISGFHGSTFDVTISDRSETDIPAFLVRYPALGNRRIEKAIMQR
jgi:hypothetical protein